MTGNNYSYPYNVEAFKFDVGFKLWTESNNWNNNSGLYFSPILNGSITSNVSMNS